MRNIFRTTATANEATAETTAEIVATEANVPAVGPFVPVYLDPENPADAEKIDAAFAEAFPEGEIVTADTDYSKPAPTTTEVFEVIPVDTIAVESPDVRAATEKKSRAKTREEKKAAKIAAGIVAATEKRGATESEKLFEAARALSEEIEKRTDERSEKAATSILESVKAAATANEPSPFDSETRASILALPSKGAARKASGKATATTTKNGFAKTTKEDLFALLLREEGASIRELIEAGIPGSASTLIRSAEKAGYVNATTGEKGKLRYAIRARDGSGLVTG